MKNLLIITLLAFSSCNKYSEEDKRIIKSIQENEIECMERGLNADTSYAHAIERYERRGRLGDKSGLRGGELLPIIFVVCLSYAVYRTRQNLRY